MKFSRVGCGAGLATLAAFADAQPGTPLRESWYFGAKETVLQAPRAVAVGADCVVWVADQAAGVYRLNCAGGPPLLVSPVGRERDEYQMPWAAGPAPGASVALFDRERQRVRSYAENGAARELRDLRFPEAITGEVAAIALTPLGVRALVYQFPNANDPGSLSSLLIAFNPESTRRDTLLVLDGIPSIYWGSSFGGSHLAVPHHRRPLVAFAPDGSFAAGYSDASVVALRDVQGRMLREIQLEFLAARAVSGGDRDAFADSVRKATDREMIALHYNAPEKKKYQAQIATYLREDVTYPPQRQLYERFVIDASGEFLWVELTGSGKSYTRSWEIYSLTGGGFVRRVTVPHKGAVISAAVQGEALYVVERSLDGDARVAKYAEK
jgi:hypothetical protein